MQDLRTAEQGSGLRWVGYTALVVPFVLSFFTRFAPGTFSGAVAADLGIGATGLGLATGTYFYVYTAMQVPAGLLIDRYGVRRPVAIGTLVSAAGLVLYATASALPAAVVGSALIGLGTSTSFLGVLQANSRWFAGSLFGLMSGVTLLLGNLGSVAAGGPLAGLLRVFDWRQILLGTAVICVAAAAAVPLFVRLPEPAAAAGTVRTPMRTVLRECFADRTLILVAVAAVGTNATFYTFSGLWGAPYLTHGLGMSEPIATSVISLSLIVYGAVSLVVGRIADRVAARAKLVMLVGALSVAGWLIILATGGGPVWIAVCAMCAAGGAAGGVVVGFSLVSERFAGVNATTALALVNGAVFLGVAVLESAFGGLFDLARHGHSASGALGAPRSAFVPGITLLTAVAIAGLIAAVWLVRAGRDAVAHDIAGSSR